MNNDSQKKLDLILHPVRLRILLALVGTEQTASHLARALSDIPLSSLYRHLQKLIAAGLIEIVAQRQVRGAVEKTLRVANDAAVIDLTDLKRMSTNDYRQTALVFTTQLLHDFERYLQRPGFDLQQDLAGLRQATLYATDAEWVTALTAMQAALLPLLSNGPGAGRVARRMATITFPIPEESDPSAEKGTSS